MADIIKGEMCHDVLRLYDKNNQVSSRGGFVVVWSYDKPSDSLFVACSLCSPEDHFNKRIGRTRAEERFNELFFTTKPVNTNLSFVISNKDLMDFLEDANILPEWWKTFSDELFEQMIYQPISKKFSKEFVHNIVLATIAELWHERYDKNYNLTLNHKGAKV